MIAWLLAAASIVGCEQPSGSAGTRSASAETSAAAPSASSTATASALASSSAAPAAPHAGRWTGSYKATKAEVRVPKGVRYQVWEKDDGKAHVGAGTIEIEVDAKGSVTGSSTGALGAMTVRGRLEEGKLSAALSPKDPNGEPAMSGVLSGEASDEKLSAKLRVSNHDATIVRGSALEMARQ